MTEVDRQWITLMMEVARTSEMLAFFEMTLRYIPESCHLQQSHWLSSISRILIIIHICIVFMYLSLNIISLYVFVFYFSEKRKDWKEISMKIIPFCSFENQKCIYTYLLLMVHGRQFGCFTSPQYILSWKILLHIIWHLKKEKCSCSKSTATYSKICTLPGTLQTIG
jgi:hypothetical protein